jgi:hypothetical protein
VSNQVLVRRNRFGPLRRDRIGNRQVTRELTRHLSRIERTMALATREIGELGAIHRYAFSKAATYVAVAQYLVSVAGGGDSMTAATWAQFERLTEIYLNTVTQITEEVVWPSLPGW